MNAVELLVLLVAATLAYVNGANDVSNGVATLVGSGVTDFRRATAWGAAWTGVGGLFGAVFASSMLVTFGHRLLVSNVTPTLAAGLAAFVGATIWVQLATRTGLPVSTTHAIVGSLVGVASAAYGIDAVVWHAMGAKVLLPLLLSPFLSLLATAVLLRVVPRRDQVDRPLVRCVPLGHLHWLTSGATSLARGMNDAPKIVALALAASALDTASVVPTAVLFAVVTVAMVAGSLLAGRRVTRVLAKDVTSMSNREGFAANLVTAVLVTTSAVHGLPVSTTHVSAGGIFGAGVGRGTLDRPLLRKIVLAWVVTLPAAALLGALCYVVAAGVSG